MMVEFKSASIILFMVSLIILSVFSILENSEASRTKVLVGEDLIILCDIGEGEIRQGNTLEVEMTVVNLRDVNYTINLALSFDWFTNETEWPGSSHSNGKIYYYTISQDLETNNTLNARDHKTYLFEIEVNDSVTLGPHEYHFRCFFFQYPYPEIEGGAIPPPPAMRSEFFNDIEVLEMDSDGDGVVNSKDMFPFDPTETRDQDLDGIGDNSDRFPTNTGEWTDADGDGVGNNGDEFPFDSMEWSDQDLDGVGDNADAFPLDPAASIDLDGDGYPERWNDGFNEKNSTSDLKLDRYPLDENKWENEKEGGRFDPMILGMIIGAVIMLVLGVTIASIVVVSVKRNSG